MSAALEDCSSSGRPPSWCAALASVSFTAATPTADVNSSSPGRHVVLTGDGAEDEEEGKEGGEDRPFRNRSGSGCSERICMGRGKVMSSDGRPGKHMVLREDGEDGEEDEEWDKGGEDEEEGGEGEEIEALCQQLTRQ